MAISCLNECGDLSFELATPYSPRMAKVALQKIGITASAESIGKDQLKIEIIDIDDKQLALHGLI